MNRLLISGYSQGGKPSIQFGEYEDFLENPSFCCVDQDILFTLNEVEGTGKIFMYRKKAHGLELLDEMAVEGGTMCHLSYSPKHRLLFGACYGTGHIFSVEVLENKFGEVKTFLRLDPLNTDQISRAHCVQMDKREGFLYAVNIHTDKIHCFRISGGKLIANELFSVLQLPSGNGPRHIVFHPTMPLAYIITEYSNVIFVAKQDIETGALELIQEVTTLPQGYEGESYGSTCVISSDQQYLYTGNRGHNSIAVFKLLEDGTLEAIDHTSCEGDWPRHIACTQDGEDILICNQRSNEVVMMKIDKETGLIGSAYRRIPFNEPSFIQEVW